MAVALDSSAIVAFLDRDDALHVAAEARLIDLLGKERLLASVVSYAEVITGAKLGHHSEEKVRGFFSEVISEIAPVSIEVADRAAELRARGKALQMPDALILATADLDPEVKLLICGDEKVAKTRGLNCRIELLHPMP